MLKSTNINDWIKSVATAAVVVIGMLVLGIIAILRDGSATTTIVDTLDQVITWGMIALVGLRGVDVLGNVLATRSAAQVTIAAQNHATPAPPVAPPPSSPPDTKETP